MVLLFYSPIEYQTLEPIEEKVEIIVAQTNVEKIVRSPMKELDSRHNQV
jgi:hypothetical protein